jgi:hypothetical protein
LVSPGSSLMVSSLIRSFVRGAIALCAGLVTSQAHAYGGTAWGPITVLSLYRGTVRTGALIQPSVAFTNADNCSNAANLFIDFSTTEAPDGKALYATALAALLAGKSVSIGTLGCSSEGYPLVYGINVR